MESGGSGETKSGRKTRTREQRPSPPLIFDFFFHCSFRGSVTVTPLPAHAPHHTSVPCKTSCSLLPVSSDPEKRDDTQKRLCCTKETFWRWETGRGACFVDGYRPAPARPCARRPRSFHLGYIMVFLKPSGVSEGNIARGRGLGTRVRWEDARLISHVPFLPFFDTRPHPRHPPLSILPPTPGLNQRPSTAPPTGRCGRGAPPTRARPGHPSPVAAGAMAFDRAAASSLRLSTRGREGRGRRARRTPPSNMPTSPGQGTACVAARHGRRARSGGQGTAAAGRRWPRRRRRRPARRPTPPRPAPPLPCPLRRPLPLPQPPGRPRQGRRPRARARRGRWPRRP